MSKSPYDIILHPLFTEKSASMRAEDKISFVVDGSANKIEIKAAVEEIFDVKDGVDSVRTQNVRGKIRRFGRTSGKRPNWKKAIITLKEGYGDKIDFFDS